MFRTPALGNDKMPPVPATVIFMATGRKEPLGPVVRFSMVEPFRAQMAPELAVSAAEPSKENLAPVLTVRVEVPRAMAPPALALITVPSSIVIPVAVKVVGTVTVKLPVASVPAEKMAVSVVPLQGDVAALPVESVLQLASVMFQFPVGVAPPAPAVAPLMSQYLLAA